MTTLRIEDVSKQFGGLHAVSGLNMEVVPGRVTGLIGPNGAGKTTIVNLITGVFKLTSGNIHFGDKDLTAAPRHEVALAGIARTFQTLRLLPDASIVDNIVIGMYRHQKSSMVSRLLQMKSSREENARFHADAFELLARFGMEQYAHQPAAVLSYGDQRRLEIMRALALKPQLLILDEPVAGMNDVEASRLARIFESLAHDGMGILVIEHNMGFVSDLCDHIYVIDSGRLLSQGAPHEVLTDPRVVTAYLGEDIHA